MSSGDAHADAREAMRQRVERALENRLPWVPVWFGDRISEHTLNSVAVQLPVLVAMGALSEDEAAGWRARFARTEQVWRAPEDEIFDENVKTAAAAVLEERFDAFARSEPGQAEQLGELQAALSVLRAVRLISKEEQAAWHERILAAIVDRKPPAPEPEPPYRATDLRRMVPCPSQRLGGIRLTCLELYGDCVILRWHRVLSADQAGAAVSAQREARDEQALRDVGQRFAAAFELRDEVGTAYRAAAMPRAQTGGWRVIGGQAGYPLWGASPFVPAVPQHADRLHAHNGTDRFTIDLR